MIDTKSALRRTGRVDAEALAILRDDAKPLTAEKIAGIYMQAHLPAHAAMAYLLRAVARSDKWVRNRCIHDAINCMSADPEDAEHALCSSALHAPTNVMRDALWAAQIVRLLHQAAWGVDIEEAGAK